MSVRCGKAAFAFVLILASTIAHGQVATGAYPYGTFDTLGFDTVNVGNLNVSFSIPILNKAGRGSPFTYALAYNSSVWYPVTSDGSKTWQPLASWGWSGLSPASPAGQSAITYDYLVENPQCYVIEEEHGTQTRIYYGYETYSYSNFVYYDSKGGSHPFGGLVTGVSGSPDEGTCPANGQSPVDGLTIEATDGSGYTLAELVPGDGFALLTDARGNTTSPLYVQNTFYSYEDTNGNKITSTNGAYTDTTGSVALTVDGIAPSNTTLTYSTTSGNQASYTVTYATYTVQTAFGCSGIGEYGPTSASLVSSITLPDGSSYNFSYEETPGVPGNVTGRLAAVQLPQGGSIKYTYTGDNNGIECADGSTSGLTRTLNSDSGSAASTWTYARTTGAGTSQTAVVDGLDNNKSYSFVLASNPLAGLTAEYYETQRTIYEGAATGTPVLARQTCYNAASPPCTTTEPSLPISQIDTYESLNGSGLHGSTATYNSYGVQTEAEVYDFGTSSSRGPLLRKEVWTYGYSIVDLPTEDAVYDGSGNLAGEALYGYDSLPVTATSNVPQHVAVSGPRGNLTSETFYANSSTSYPLSIAYYDTGSLVSITAPDWLTFPSYDPTYVYLTGLALPTPSSDVGLSSSATYDTSYTGLPLTSTDLNAQVTHFSSYDSLWRPLEIQYPDGGKTTWTYPSAAPYTTVTTDTYQTPSVYATTENQVDGYGRQSRTAVANGQSSDPYYQQDTCYDANGNVSFVSYPYQGSGLSESKICSGAGTSYSYDVLGRLKSVIQSDGEAYTYTYSERATQSIDENGVTRISQVDGLGRTTIVCEISSGADLLPSGTTATSCGTDIPGTGFVTTYAYTLATPTTTITQGAQTRTFQTDWLGRATSVTEPESGTTTYSYAYNSTGLAVTRTRPKANQTNPSVTTTTTTQYDSVGRVVSITYSDGTPTKTFTYDSTTGVSTGTGAWFSDLSQVNLKGRLSMASIAGSTGTAYSYDPMGRISYLDECLPSSCGTVLDNRQLKYTYDLAGDLLTSTDGSSVQSTYTVSLAGEVLTLISSQNNSTNPPNILSGVQSGPDGPVSFSLGNGLCGVYSYDALGRLNGGSVYNGGSPPSCAGGTQEYGFTNGWKGSQLKNSFDSVLAQTSTYGYDEFNRLTSRTVTSGTVQNFTYAYDRYGNRWEQNVTAGSGPDPQLTFNTATNQISSSGYAYDAAGNLTNDSIHTYTYDAEGNITAVDGGSTAQYVYDALNDRVQTVANGATTGFIFNVNGQHVSEWSGNTELKGQYYWGGAPVAFYTGGDTYFQHRDWLGTERMQTTYNGSVEGTSASLPFGDAQTIFAGADPSLYAGLDYDPETDTDHAQFRQYSNTQGHWMSPDQYLGSYDFSNPQSMNRYAYVLNTPLGYIDPLGLEQVQCPPGTDPSILICIDVPPPPPCDGFCPPISVPPGFGGGGGDPTPSSGPTSTCTISNGRTTAPGPGQATGKGAFGFVPPNGSVAVDPWALGLPPGAETNSILAPNASQITFTFNPAPNLPSGFPTTITLGDVVAPSRYRMGGADFNGLFVFDIYRLPTLNAAYAATSPDGVPVSVTVTYPSSLPISCNGPTVDSPIQGPLPSPPGPVPAVIGRPQ